MIGKSPEPAESPPPRVCVNCGRELQRGEFVRCDPCLRDWYIETNYLIELSREAK